MTFWGPCSSNVAQVADNRGGESMTATTRGLDEAVLWLGIRSPLSVSAANRLSLFCTAIIFYRDLFGRVLRPDPAAG